MYTLTNANHIKSTFCFYNVTELFIFSLKQKPSFSPFPADLHALLSSSVDRRSYDCGSQQLSFGGAVLPVSHVFVRNRNL